MKATQLKNFCLSGMGHIDFLRNRSKNVFSKTALILVMMLTGSYIHAQSLAGSTWDLVSTTPSAGFINWGGGVLTLTDTVTGSGCQGAAVTETGSGYNPTSGTTFNQCFAVFFGCPGNDQIGTAGNPYTDENGDGMAFSFWKTSGSGTYNVNNGNTCGGGLGYHNALSGGDNKMISIEFDTYSSIGTDVDGVYGGGGPGSGINDEISVHKNQDSGDDGLTVNAGHTVSAGNLEDGQVHQVCITYTPGTRRLVVSVDGTNRMNYDMGADGLQDYFGNNTLNYSWSAGKYGAKNMQTIGPGGNNLVTQIGHPFCPWQLPVRFLSFTAEKINGEVILNWATATEVNNAKFVIERSNGTTWEAVGEIAGAGNSGAIIEYTFVDEASLSGTSYYRIRQVDTDGLYAFSSVVAVQTPAMVSIQPNPFEDVLAIRTDITGTIKVEICDVLGKLLYEETRENNGAFDVRPELPSGAYVITVRNESFVQQQKVIKK